MTVISGRYGAVQRVLPTRYDSKGKAVWAPSILDPDITSISKSDLAIADTLHETATIHNDALWTEAATAAIVNGASRGLASAGGGHMVSTMTSWSFENTINTITYQASNTRGYAGKLKGLHSCTGNISGLGGIPPIAPGQRFRFYGFTGPSNAQLDNKVGTVYRIAAIANSVQIQISYQRDNPITWTVGWQSDWQWHGDELVAVRYDDVTRTFGEAGFWDYTKPPCDKLMPSDTCLMIVSKNAPELVGGNLILPDSIQACFQNLDIQFNTEVANYANSCSAAAGGWQSGTIGTTDCTISATVHGDNYDIFRTNHLPGDNVYVRAYIEGGEVADEAACKNKAYWEFNKLFLGTYGGLNVDLTNNAPLSFNVNMEFNAFPDCEYGYIRYMPGTIGYDSSNDPIYGDPVDFISMIPPSLLTP